VIDSGEMIKESLSGEAELEWRCERHDVVRKI